MRASLASISGHFICAAWMAFTSAWLTLFFRNGKSAGNSLIWLSWMVSRFFST